MTSQDMSAVYIGEVRHRRFVPVSHQLDVPLFMMCLDLDELPELLKRRWFFTKGRFNFASFHRPDYLGEDNSDLKECVINKVSQDLKLTSDPADQIHKVKMLTNVRYCGFIFNPVTFYYCYDFDGQLMAILAEITNTPWAERHCYSLPVGRSNSQVDYQGKGHNKHIFRFAKNFHVSPFNPMNMNYRWAFSEMEDDMHVHMDNYLIETDSTDNQKHFDATLVLKRFDIDKALPKVLIQYPFLTVKVVIGIYWNALKLCLKRSPFYDHP